MQPITLGGEEPEDNLLPTPQVFHNVGNESKERGEHDTSTALDSLTNEEIAVAPKPQSAVGAELLDVRAVASLLGGCSTRHVYRLADAGRMPRPTKLGRLVRWRRAELTAWIDAGCPSQQSGGHGRDR